MTRRHIGTVAPQPNPRMVAVDPIDPLDILGMLRAVWYGKWIILFTTVCMVGLAGYYAFQVAQPRFAATATIKVDVQPIALRDISQQWPGSGTDLASLNTEVTVLTSRHILGQIVDQLDLIADPEFNRHLNPVSALSINSVRTRLRNYFAGTTDTPPDDAAILEKTVQNLRGVMTANRPRDTYIFQVTAQSGSAQKAALIANTAAQVYVTDQIRAKDTASQAAERWPSERGAELQHQLQEKETAVTDLIATAQIQEASVLDALSNQILNAEQQLDEARTALALSETQDDGASIASYQAEILERQNQITRVEGHLTRLNAQLKTQSSGLVQLKQMQREADATRVLYEAFLARQQETRIQRGLEYPESQLIAPAMPGQYIGPRKVLILTIAAMIGAAIGLVILIAQHGMRKGAFSATALREATGLHVFAQMPRFADRKPQQLLKALKPRQNNGFSEAIQAIRTSLMIASNGQLPAVILSTSSVPGEGNDTVAIALSHSLTRAGKSVLLVRADQHSGRPIRDAKVGLSDVLNGNAAISDVIFCDPNLATDVLMTYSADGPSDTFLADGFVLLMADLRDRYDHIIVDAPPVLMAPDTQILSQYSDAIIYAVRWAKTPLPAVQLGLRVLEDANAPAAGLILTNVNARKIRKWGGAPFVGYGASSVPI